MRIGQYVLARRAQADNLYGPFALEILTAEGFTGFELCDLDEQPLPALQPHDIALLTRCYLKDHEIASLLAAVRQGTGLVVVQPAPRLAAACGWEPRKRVAYPGWIRIGPNCPGAGLTIQAHLPVDLYTPRPDLGEWSRLADAVQSDWSATGSPAAVAQRMGKGFLALFFYDLPAAVARIRFGNPDLSSRLTTGLWDWLHAGDLFAGQVDERVKHLPQADLHGQLLAKALELAAPCPMARWWYYPEANQRTAAVVQSDDDWSTPEQFKELADCLEANGGRATFYLVKDTQLSKAAVGALRAAGHTFGPHIDPRFCADEWYFDFQRVVREETADFDRRFGARSATLQCHRAPWQGYMDWVPTFCEQGYRLLFAYLSVPVAFWSMYMCGSGRPLRFFDPWGGQYPCWQQPVVIYDDESFIPTVKQKGAQPLLDRFDALLEDALQRTHTAVPILSHPVSFSTYSRPYMEPIFQRLNRAGAPILNGDGWLAFTERRAAARIGAELLVAGVVRYHLAPFAGPLCLMIPWKTEAIAGTISVDGQPATMDIHRRFGTTYACIALEGKNAGIRVDAQA